MEIKLMVMDVDGTLTDGKIYFGANGELMKAFDIKDGYAIIHMPENGVATAVITARSSDIVANRCKELKIEYVYQGVKDKIKALNELVSRVNADKGWNITLENAAYAGDDVIDIECMKACGASVCPADAVDEVKAIATFVSTKDGGKGAIREFHDKFIKPNRKK